MSRYLVQLGKYVVEWSTIVDAPLTLGLTRKEMTKYLKEQYGVEGTRDLPERLERLDRKGTTSMMHDSAKDAVSNNRAGRNEEHLTFEQLVEWAKQSRRAR